MRSASSPLSRVTLSLAFHRELLHQMSTSDNVLTTAGSADVDSTRLSGQMSTTQLVLSVLAFSSPLTCLAGYFSLTIMSTGQTAPVAFAVVTIVLLVFSLGYMAMTRHMPRPGAFYAYISEGLGRRMGLASAFLATMSYSVIGMGVYCFAGLTITSLTQAYLGVTIAWWWGALAAWAAVAALGYFNVDVSARILVWVMLVEVAVVIVFDFVVVGRGGDSGLSLSPLNALSFAAGGEVWVGLLFAMLVFIGFEATALYRDEVRDPDRTIPRATYIAVSFIGILYTVSVLVMVLAFGSGAEDAARSDPAGMFDAAAGRYIGAWFADLAGLLVVTAVLAASLSIHNACTRYVFNLGADRALPASLSAVHHRHRSPYRASAAVSALTWIGVAAFAVAGTDPAVAYGQLAGLGNAGVFVLMTLVSAAVVVWFRRNRTVRQESVWVTTVAPGVSAVALTALLVFALLNFNLVAGDADGNTVLLLALASAFVIGFVVASVIKVRRPNDFHRLGGADR